MAADSIAASRHRCNASAERDLDRRRRPEVDTGGSRSSPKLASNDGSFGKTAGQPAQTNNSAPTGIATDPMTLREAPVQDGRMSFGHPGVAVS
jgi:hypothetical protein